MGKRDSKYKLSGEIELDEGYFRETQFDRLLIASMGYKNEFRYKIHSALSKIITLWFYTHVKVCLNTTYQYFGFDFNGDMCRVVAYPNRYIFATLKHTALGNLSLEL